MKKKKNSFPKVVTRRCKKLRFLRLKTKWGRRNEENVTLYIGHKHVERETSYIYQGSDCGSVGRVVVSDTRYPRFESSHWQNCINLFTVNFIEKTKINKKEARNGTLKTSWI